MCVPESSWWALHNWKITNSQNYNVMPLVNPGPNFMELWCDAMTCKSCINIIFGPKWTNFERYFVRLKVPQFLETKIWKIILVTN